MLVRLWLLIAIIVVAGLVVLSEPVGRFLLRTVPILAGARL